MLVKKIIKLLAYLTVSTVFFLILPFALLQIIFLIPINWYLKRKTLATDRQRELIIFLFFIITLSTWITYAFLSLMLHGK